MVQGSTGRHTLVRPSAPCRCDQYDLLGPLGSRAYAAMEVSGGAMDPGTKRAMKVCMRACMCAYERAFMCMRAHVRGCARMRFRCFAHAVTNGRVGQRAVGKGGGDGGW